MHKRLLAASLVCAATVPALAACSSSGGAGKGPATFDPKAPVTITVSNQPTADQAAPLKLFKQQIAAFEKKYPNITVKGSEDVWDSTTFAAQAAGGTLPTTYVLPISAIQGLIQRKQVADLTQPLKDAGLDSQLNPTLLKLSESDGSDYAIPLNGYTLGLMYNKALFAKAGISSPPTTWDEVRTDSKLISQKTDAAGFAMYTVKEQGGWMLSNMTYTYGGRMENSDATKTSFGDATKQALQLLHDMRWDDDSMGSNFLYDIDAGSKAFAAGKIGMLVDAPDRYGMIVSADGLSSSDFGMAAMPMSSSAGSDQAVLSGGTVLIVSPKASPAQQAAALKWADFEYLNGFLDKSAAVSQAKANAAAKQPVGIPGVLPVSEAQTSTYTSWIKPYINVPLDNFAPYVQGKASQTIAAEPPNQTLALYTTLSPVLQAVLTQKDANIDSLLSTAGTTVDRQLGR